MQLALLKKLPGSMKRQLRLLPLEKLSGATYYCTFAEAFVVCCFSGRLRAGGLRQAYAQWSEYS